MSLDNEKYAAYLMPLLTALKQPLTEMGMEAARMLLGKLEAKEGLCPAGRGLSRS